MPEMSVFGHAQFRVQFKTSLPTGEEERAQRQSEYADMLAQVRAAIQAAVTQVTEREGWQVVLVQDRG